MEVLGTSLPQSRLKTPDVSDDASGKSSIDSTPTTSTLNYLRQNDVFDLLWLAFDSKQAVHGIFNVQGAVAAGKAEFVVFAWQNLMMEDHLRDVIEHRTWQLCKENQIPTLFVNSMYFLGHACGFDYSIRAVAVTFQEGSELTEEIMDMKKRIQRLRQIPGDPEAEDRPCAGVLDRKPSDFEAEETICIENLGSKPEGLGTEIPVSADVLESKPGNLKAIQPMLADSIGIPVETSEIAQSSRADSFGSTSSVSSTSDSSDDFDFLGSSRVDSFGSQSSISDGSVAGDPTCAESTEDE